MNINFRQGIVTYAITGPIQAFLAKTGDYVSLQTANGQTDVAFAFGDADYLLTEASDVINAWGPIAPATDTWLFWDLDLVTAVRTFGFTIIEPLFGAAFPATPPAGQHFFNTTDNKMYLYENGVWRVALRMFAAKVNASTFTPLGAGFPLRPFAGTQVGIFQTNVMAGRILVDDTATPIRKVNGEFFTTESDFFVNGSPVNTIRFEANVLTATSIANLGAFQVVKYTDFNRIDVATYNDLQTTMIAIAMESFTTGDTGTVVAQGTIVNPQWNFATVGAELWIDGAGVFTDVDPHVTDPITFPTAKPAIGRVISPTTIFFDQGLGGEGDIGPAGPEGEVDFGTGDVYGISRLSETAVDPDDPIAVGDNDPRLTDARVPLDHTQAATTIVFTPYGALTAIDVQGAIQQLEDFKIDIAGGTMTGELTLSGDPVNPLHAATKQYVDSLSPTLPLNEIGYGDGSFITSSPLFLFNPTTSELSTARTGGNAFFTWNTSGGVYAPVIRLRGPSTLESEITSSDLIASVTPSRIRLDNGTGGLRLDAGISGTGLLGAVVDINAGFGVTSGGHLELNAGASTTTGGDVLINAGVGTTDDGGRVELVAGNGGIAGGDLDITAGDGTSDTGGNITITAGDGGSVSGGDILLFAGDATGGIPGIFGHTTEAGYEYQRSGNFSVDGDAQSKQYVLRTTTSAGSNVQYLYLDGLSGSRQMVLPDSTTWRFEAYVVAKTSAGVSAAYEVKGCVDRGVGVATVALVGTPSVNVTSEDDATWDVNIDVDVANGALRIEATGPAASTARWVAFVRTVEVTF